MRTNWRFLWVSAYTPASQTSKSLRHFSVQKKNVKFGLWEELRPKFIEDPWTMPPISRLANPHAWKERLGQRVRENLPFPGKVYHPEKKYRRRVYTRILKESQFVLIMQQNLPLYEIRRALRGKVRLTHIKSSLLPLKDLNYEGIQGMVTGPIIFAYPIPERNSEEFLLEDIRLLLSADPDNRTLMTLGGIVQGQIIGQNLLERLKTVSIDEVRSELVSLLISHQRNIIQTLRSPTSQLFKVLQHRATTSPSDSNPASPSAPSTSSPTSSPTKSDS